MQNIKRVGAAAAVLAILATGASAQDISNMVDTQLKGQLMSLGNLAGMIAFLAGFVFGIMGFMKLRANAQNPQDPSNKVSTAFMMIFIGAGLIAVPTVMGIGVTSLFGGSNNTTSLDGGGGFTKIK
jgi:intracellular multiplication protein IcmD